MRYRVLNNDHLRSAGASQYSPASHHKIIFKIDLFHSSAIFSLFPYITLGSLALPTEVQPWAALISWIAVGITFARGQLRCDSFYCITLFFSLLFLAYIPINDSIGIGQYLRKSLSILLCFAILIAARGLTASKIISLLKVSAIIWLFFGLLGIIFPFDYLNIVRKIVPGALGAYGSRGVTGLAPEATDYGFTMVYFWVLALIASNAEQARNRRGAPIWLFFIIMLNIFIAESGSGLFSLVLLQAIYWATFDSRHQKNRISTNTIFLTLFILTFFILLIVSLPNTGIRGLDLMAQALQNPLMLIDTTLSYRLAHNLVGFFGFIDSNLLGWGAGSFTEKGIEVYSKFDISGLLGVQGWYRENIPLTLTTSPLAIFPVLIFEYGIFGLTFILYIFSSVFRSTIMAKYMVATLLFLTWAQSFPLAYPLFWLLLGLIRNADFATCNSQDKIINTGFHQKHKFAAQ